MEVLPTLKPIAKIVPTTMSFATLKQDVIPQIVRRVQDSTQQIAYSVMLMNTSSSLQVEDPLALLFHVMLPA